MKISLFTILFLMLAGDLLSQQNSPSFPAAGSIHPDAKFLEVDKMFPFNRGAAIVWKGRTTALINASGEFIVPYNKYFFFYHYDISQINRFDSRVASRFGVPAANGIFTASTVAPRERPTFLFNSQGKLIYTAPQGYDMGERDDLEIGLGDGPFNASLGTIQKNHLDNIKFLKEISVSADGSLAEFPLQTERVWGEGLFAFQDKATKKWGYKNKKGTVVIKPSYKAARAFSDGLAAVCIENDTRESVWGYINKEGKVVIPFKFSIPPGDFGNGLAYVIPRNKDEYEFAFINKQGELKLKVPEASVKELDKHGFNSSDYNSLLLRDNRFCNGYFIGNSYPGDKEISFLDTTGKIFNSSEILHLFNLPDTFKIWPAPFFNGQMYFTTYDKYKTNINKKGMLNFNDKSYVPAIFDVLSAFDPVSKLAYAELVIGWDEKNKKDKLIKGYIDMRGVFVLVLKENDSNW